MIRYLKIFYGSKEGFHSMNTLNIFKGYRNEVIPAMDASYGCDILSTRKYLVGDGPGWAMTMFHSRGDAGEFIQVGYC
jgi:hypothetical protein